MLGIFTDDGCTGHHYPEEGTAAGTYRIRAAGNPIGDHYTAEVKEILTCQHDGCGKRKESWRVLSRHDDPEDARLALARHVLNDDGMTFPTAYI